MGRPNKWIAVVLSLFLNPLGLVYVGAPRKAIAVFATAIAFALIGFFGLPSVYFATCAIVTQLVVVAYGVITSYRIATKAEQRKDRPQYTRWYSLAAMAAVYAIAVLSVRAFLYEPFRAPSSSMLPTIGAGANIVVQKWGFGHYSTFGISLVKRPISTELKHGDIIVFDYPRDVKLSYVKRIVGLPGDKVAYRDGQIFVNGVSARAVPLRDYLDPESFQYSKQFQETLDGTSYSVLLRANPIANYISGYDFPHKERCAIESDTISCEVPQGNYFVLGDNRDNSADSRYWGFVSADLVVGKVVKIIQ